MKKGIVYAFILSVICMIVSGIMGQRMLAGMLFLSALVFGFTSLFLLLRQAFRATSKAAHIFKAESSKAFHSFNLFYRLEKLNLYRGVRQLKAGEKKLKLLMRLIRQRFTEKSLTSVRFRQEAEIYAEKITQNLEQIVSNKECLTSINPGIWQDQIRLLQRTNAAFSHQAIAELQQHLISYESLGKQYKELLAENDQLLTTMDKAILALSQENHQVFMDNSPTLLTGEEAFINKFFKQ